MNSKSSSAPPSISVIVPLFNREKFLPQLFKTLESQTFEDFELILIDDGSTDNTAQWLQQKSLSGGQHLIYEKQTNAGPYSARNNGLSKAKGKYIAFLDSDDEWPDYHLEKFYNALEANPNVDWVFGYIQRIDHNTGKVIEASNFINAETGEPHPFIKLNTSQLAEEVCLIDDANAGSVAIRTQVPGSTQCALIRASVFESIQFDPSYRTTYDRFFAIKCLLRGFKFGYVNRCHQIYHIHDSHISLVTGGAALKREKSAQTLIRGYKELFAEINSTQEKQALKKTLASKYIWGLSVALQDQKKYFQATQACLSALRLKPTTLAYWRQFVKCALLSLIPRSGHPVDPSSKVS